MSNERPVDPPSQDWYIECPRCDRGRAKGIKQIPDDNINEALQGQVRMIAHFLGDCGHLWGVIVYHDERRKKYWSAQQLSQEEIKAAILPEQEDAC
jgi:hypothetical protein